MKLFSALTAIFFVAIQSSTAQDIVSISPQFASVTDTGVVITYDASKGSAGLLNESIIYAHTGLITQSSTGANDWKHVIAGWTVNLEKAKLQRIGLTSLYTLYIGNIRNYYNLPQSESVLRIALVFRNADGSKTGKTASGGDIFIDVYQGNFKVLFNQPAQGTFFNANDIVQVSAAASRNATLTLFANGNPVATAANTAQLLYSDTFKNIGINQIEFVVKGEENGNVSYDTTYIVQRTFANIVPLPNNFHDGINYLNDSTVALVLFAPHKTYTYVIGDFNNWRFNNDYLMNRTPDGSRYWIVVNGLIPGVEYGFQYCIGDERLRVADVYAEKILDPFNDGFISNATYPNLKPYPHGKTTEMVSVLQTAQQPYIWQNTGFKKPNVGQLVIYELLLRDFIGKHDFKTLTDTIPFLKNLGINCVKIMPVNEFEGNESWGYNPMFFFALDKYYGTKNDFKAFVDACHAHGIAVVMDMVLNHSFGQNPQVRMYFDPTAGQYGQPTAQNPWFNQTDKHPFGVGYDYNHESPATIAFADRVIKFWLTEYNIDGYRFDLSKGFTQKFSPDVASWNAYDQSRVNIWNRIRNEIIKYAPDAYLILEHLGDNSEERVLADMGFMLWGKMTDNYAEALMGYDNNKANLSWGDYKTRNFAKPHLITYAESHDEERVMYTTLNFGNNANSHNTRNLKTALQRSAAMHAFLIPLHGPKMIWMGGEVGYEVSINFNGRLGNKPYRWEYLKDADRLALFRAVARMNKLKQHEALNSSNYEFNTANVGKYLKITHDSMNVVIVGNFGTTTLSVFPQFQDTGWWYNYINGDSVYINNINAGVSLQAGNYRIFTSKNIGALLNPDLPYTSTSVNPLQQVQLATFYPNPVTDMLTIELAQNTETDISIINAQGITVTQLHQNSAGIDIDLSSLAPGIYLVQVHTTQGSMVKKIIKQ